jgi:hypothetical protein
LTIWRASEQNPRPHSPGDFDGLFRAVRHTLTTQIADERLLAFLVPKQEVAHLHARATTGAQFWLENSLVSPARQSLGGTGIHATCLVAMRADPDLEDQHITAENSDARPRRAKNTLVGKNAHLLASAASGTAFQVNLDVRHTLPLRNQVFS